MATIPRTGDATVRGEGIIDLPAEVLRALGWREGDRLAVSVVNAETIVLARRAIPTAGELAGRLGHVFGTHEDVMRYLEEERQGWEPEEGR
jgi:AbrB family looped-hinge helix DNA binding protein